MYSKKINVLDTCKICLFRAHRKLLKEGTWQKINGPSMALHGSPWPLWPLCYNKLCAVAPADLRQLKSTNG